MEDNLYGFFLLGLNLDGGLGMRVLIALQMK